MNRLVSYRAIALCLALGTTGCAPQSSAIDAGQSAAVQVDETAKMIQTIVKRLEPLLERWCTTNDCHPAIDRVRSELNPPLDNWMFEPSLSRITDKVVIWMETQRQRDQSKDPFIRTARLFAPGSQARSSEISTFGAPILDAIADSARTFIRIGLLISVLTSGQLTDSYFHPEVFERIIPYGLSMTWTYTEARFQTWFEQNMDAPQAASILFSITRLYATLWELKRTRATPHSQLIREMDMLRNSNNIWTDETRWHASLLDYYSKIGHYPLALNPVPIDTNDSSCVARIAARQEWVARFAPSPGYADHDRAVLLACAQILHDRAGQPIPDNYQVLFWSGATTPEFGNVVAPPLSSPIAETGAHENWLEGMIYVANVGDIPLDFSVFGSQDDFLISTPDDWDMNDAGWLNTAFLASPITGTYAQDGRTIPSDKSITIAPTEALVRRYGSELGLSDASSAPFHELQEQLIERATTERPEDPSSWLSRIGTTRILVHARAAALEPAVHSIHRSVQHSTTLTTPLEQQGGRHLFRIGADPSDENVFMRDALGYMYWQSEILEQ